MNNLEYPWMALSDNTSKWHKAKWNKNECNYE